LQISKAAASSIGIMYEPSGTPANNCVARLLAPRPAGATFGRLFAGDGGRNYMRTIESYAFDSFVAEVTVTGLAAPECSMTALGCMAATAVVWTHRLSRTCGIKLTEPRTPLPPHRA
jgi:hypothetical protein